jgi:RimJ/RimL family protein N-acetyltransferase
MVETAEEHMKNDLFRGKLVRLAAQEVQPMAEAYSKWSRDAEYWRLLDSGIVRPFSVKKTKEWIEKNQEKESPDQFSFAIRNLEDDRLIGDIGLDGIQWAHKDAFVGIGLGERDTWGKGYGTDAMRIILRYAFTELNLKRVSLNVFEYNPRAMRSYEKAGFTYEGRMVGMLHREGRYWDIVFMGVLREEWERMDRIDL